MLTSVPLYACLSGQAHHLLRTDSGEVSSADPHVLPIPIHHNLVDRSNQVSLSFISGTWKTYLVGGVLRGQLHFSRASHLCSPISFPLSSSPLYFPLLPSLLFCVFSLKTPSILKLYCDHSLSESKMDLLLLQFLGFSKFSLPTPHIQITHWTPRWTY